MWIGVVLRRAKALGYQLSEESSEGWHGYAYYANVDLEDGVYAGHEVVVHGIR